MDDERKRDNTQTRDRHIDGSDHPYKSGERIFSEPDNPPRTKKDSYGDTETDQERTKQETGGPDKPTA